MFAKFSGLRTKSFLQGAAIPAALTAGAFLVGLLFSLGDDPLRTPAQHFGNGWLGVSAGLALSLYGGGASLIVLAPGLKSAPGRWRFFGAATMFGIIAAVVFASLPPNAGTQPESEEEGVVIEIKLGDG